MNISAAQLSTLLGSIGAWQDIRRSGLSESQRQTHAQQFGSGVLEQRDTLDIKTFMERYRRDFQEELDTADL